MRFVVAALQLLLDAICIAVPHDPIDVRWGEPGEPLSICGRCGRTIQYVLVDHGRRKIWVRW